MPSASGSLKDHLARSNEINITVTGRKSGRPISIPIWFVLDNELYLLPVQGSDTQWYKNVLNNPAMRIGVDGLQCDARAVPLNDAKQVSTVVEKFREKYGKSDIQKYYSKFDVAVLAEV
jgi:deazaflavin-dependent oxidoreductase (nitroreductase family)